VGFPWATPWAILGDPGRSWATLNSLSGPEQP